MMVTGLVGGALWPLGRRWAGRTLLALILGYLFFVGPMILLFGSPMTWREETWWVYRGCGVSLAAILWYAVLRPERPAV